MIHRREQRQFVITKLLFPAACARLHIFLTEVRKISVAANAFRKAIPSNPFAVVIHARLCSTCNAILLNNLLLALLHL